MDNAVVVLNANGNKLMSIAFSLSPTANSNKGGEGRTEQQQQQSVNSTTSGHSGDVTASPTSAAPAAAAAAATSQVVTAFRKTMVRAKDEPISKTLDRFRLTYWQDAMSAASSPTGAKAGKKNKQRVNPAEVISKVPPVTLFREDGSELDGTTINNEAWKLAKILRFGACDVPIHYNLPTITAIKPPPSMAVDVPVVCSGITILFADARDLLHEWRLLPATPATDATPVNPDELPLVSSHSVFTPSTELVGRKLLARCRPNVDGALWLEVETPPVVASLNVPPMERWAVAAKQKEIVRQENPSAFRVVSYNILHDSFATTKYAKSYLYPFCKEELLEMSYRKGRIVTELKAYEGDIVALQEMGRDIFANYYSPVFEELGYGSKYSVKTGSVTDGIATLYNKERFDLVSYEWLPLSITTINELGEHAKLKEEISQHCHLEEALGNVTSVGSITILRDKRTEKQQQQQKKNEDVSLQEGDELLLVTNCHLFWHPNGCHIRAIQLYLLMHRLQRRKKELAAKYPGVKISTILCGDFNCSRIGGEDYSFTPTGGYELLSTGKVTSGNYCWKKGLKFWWEVDAANDEEEKEAAETENETAASANQSTTPKAEPTTTPTTTEKKPTQIPPTTFYAPDLILEDAVAHGGFTDTHANDTDMKWTNYSLRFKEIIDHIFVSTDSLKTISTVPLPSEEEVTKETCIPSSVFPSDHVAIIADVSTRN